jgi:2-octaprenyl-6-methoxyphenol hydroxylase
MTLPSNFDYDVAIVGGGIVGATLACALRESDLKVVVVEAQSLEEAANRDRAYAVSLLSSQIFRDLGIWSQVHPQIATYRNIRLSDADYGKIVKFNQDDLNRDALGYVAPHRIVLTALQEKITASENVDWCCPATVESVTYQDTSAELVTQINGETRTIKAKVVVGADGARSRLRTWANIKTRGWKYWQSCVTFVIQHEHPTNDTAFERFWYSGPMGVLPLPGNRCQIVWTADHKDAENLQNLDDTEFLNRLEHRLGGVLGKVELVSKRLKFPVQLMQCDHYVKPRLALVGDAAHCCHPVGGQGLNLGIRDAAALAEVLQTAAQQGEDIGTLPVLQRYEKWRKGENLATLGFTDFLDRLFSNNWFPVVFTRRLGLGMLQTIRPMKRFALEFMTGLKGRSPQILQR